MAVLAMIREDRAVSLLTLGGQLRTTSSPTRPPAARAFAFAVARLRFSAPAFQCENDRDVASMVNAPMICQEVDQLSLWESPERPAYCSHSMANYPAIQSKAGNMYLT